MNRKRTNPSRPTAAHKTPEEKINSAQSTLLWRLSCHVVTCNQSGSHSYINNFHNSPCLIKRTRYDCGDLMKCEATEATPLDSTIERCRSLDTGRPFKVISSTENLNRAGQHLEKHSEPHDEAHCGDRKSHFRGYSN